MVSYQDLVEKIQELSLTERLSLLQMLVLSLPAELRRDVARGSSLARVRGMLKVDGPLPSKQDLDEAYTDFLVERHT